MVELGFGQLNHLGSESGLLPLVMFSGRAVAEPMDTKATSNIVLEQTIIQTESDIN